MNALNSKVNEPSMEEILASIRRIISDDESRIAAAQNAAPVQRAAEQPAPDVQSAAPAPQLVNDQKAFVPHTPPQVEQRAPEAGWNGKEALRELAYYQEQAARASDLRHPDIRNAHDDVRDRPASQQPQFQPQASFPQAMPQPVQLQPAPQEVQPQPAQPEPVHHQPVQVQPEYTQPVQPRQELPVYQPVADPFAPTLSGDTDRAVASSFRVLADTTRPPSISLEEVVIATIRPMLGEWLDNNLPRMVENIVREEIERIARHARF